MTTQTQRQAAIAAGSVALALLVAPGTAAARPDAGTTVQSPPATAPTNCPLRRVGDQLVRCDDLTGAGIAAARWVPEA